jgi:hypothetical protein
MKTKLPEVGKRYRSRKTGGSVHARFERLRALTPPETIAIFVENGIETEMLEDRFLIEFEELPDSKPQEEASEVDRALEELKQVQNSLPAQYGWYNKALQNVINALEAEKNREPSRPIK